MYFNEYNDISDAKRSKMDHKYDAINLTLDEYDFDHLYKKIR